MNWKELDEVRVPVQADKRNTKAGTITWREHCEVWAKYVLLYGVDQSAARLAERGGFSWAEADELLGKPLQTWKQR